MILLTEPALAWFAYVFIYGAEAMKAVRRFLDDPTAQYGFLAVTTTYEDAEKITGFRLDRPS